MKTSSSPAVLLLLTLTSSFWFSCCTKDSPCKDPKDDYYYLSDAEKSKVPYKGNDTIIFTSSAGDSISCIGQGKGTGYNVERKNGTNDCPNLGSSFFETSRWLFKRKRGNYDMQVDLIKNKYSEYTSVSILFDNVSYNITINALTDLYYQDTVFINSTPYPSFKSIGTDSSAIFYNHYHGVIRISRKNGIVWLNRLL